MKKIRRFISCYEKNGDDFIKEVEFLEVPPLHTLQEVFRIEEENPMYDEYHIDKDTFKKVSPYLAESIDINEYDIFLSCELVDD